MSQSDIYLNQYIAPNEKLPALLDNGLSFSA